MPPKQQLTWSQVASLDTTRWGTPVNPPIAIPPNEPPVAEWHEPPEIPPFSPSAITPNARRPDQGGSKGKPVKVLTNFYAITKLKVDTIWHYDVVITPEIPRQEARKMWKLLEKLPQFANAKTVFDGRCNAYSSEDLKFANGFACKVELSESGHRNSNHPTTTGGGRGTRGGRGAGGGRGRTTTPSLQFTIKMVQVNVIYLDELHRFLRREGPITSGCLIAIQALNITMSHKIFSESVTLGRSAFTSKNKVDLGGGVEKWEGVFQSVRPGQGKLYANIDVASTAFYKGGNAAELMAEIAGRRGGINDLRGFNKATWAPLQKHFKGCAFTVTHRGESHRKQYKVSEVSMQAADKTTFDQEAKGIKKTKITLTQYYATIYNLKLQYPFLPCLGVKGRDGVKYFPAEVCNIVPGRRYGRMLNDVQMTAMTWSNSIRPNERAQKIKGLYSILDFGHNEYMKAFGMEVAKEMTVVPARVLPAPQVLYKGGVSVSPQFGSWQV
ncbi:eukaryotic translation initiation factor 2C, 2 [Mortierella sp. NVP85]|nr:eukaryotic translation initiation factor 2C, 2 [Mortierella sp. NVP85]